MKKESTIKIRRQLILMALSAVVLIFTAFGWFIGMQSVMVSSFDIDIAAAENLLLSLDGVSWDTTVSINRENLEEVSYPNHTNWWSGGGLEPMSTIGQIDVNTSRLMLFEKAGITAIPGGHSLMASRVENTGDKEADGYVVFDLFVRNMTGSAYIPEYNLLDEEGIYLSVDSSVEVAIDGGVEDTGLENSVRVAFAQIGIVMITEQIRRVIEILLNSGYDISEDEIIKMIADEIKNEKIKRTAGETEIKKQFQDEMKKFLKENKKGVV